MRFTFFILILLCAISVNAQVKVIAPIIPNNPADLYPTHFDSLGKGGYIAGPSKAFRNTIPSDRRKIGMLVYCADVDSVFKLASDLVTWLPFSSGGGGGGGTPGGPNTSIQFNAMGNFGGSSDLTWNDVNKVLTFGRNLTNDSTTITGIASNGSQAATNFLFQGGAGSGSFRGGGIYIRGGDGLSGTNANGGNIIIRGGAGDGSGVNGKVIIKGLPAGSLNDSILVRNVTDSSIKYISPLSINKANTLQTVTDNGNITNNALWVTGLNKATPFQNGILLADDGTTGYINRSTTGGTNSSLLISGNPLQLSSDGLLNMPYQTKGSFIGNGPLEIGSLADSVRIQATYAAFRNSTNTSYIRAKGARAKDSVDFITKAQLDSASLAGGTVKSVGLSSSTLTISGSPVTTTGTITANVDTSIISTKYYVDTFKTNVVRLTGLQTITGNKVFNSNIFMGDGTNPGGAISLITTSGSGFVTIFDPTRNISTQLSPNGVQFNTSTLTQSLKLNPSPYNSNIISYLPSARNSQSADTLAFQGDTLTTKGSNFVTQYQLSQAGQIISITGSMFTTGTTYANTNWKDVNGKALKPSVFFNNINRFLLSSEYDTLSGGGISILIPGFNAQSSHLFQVFLTGFVSNAAPTNLPDITFNSQSANYTLVLSDKNKMIDLSLSSAGTLTIPPSSSVNFNIGSQIILNQAGTGQITITPGAGVTIISADGARKTRVQYSTVTLIKKATDTWQLMGDII